MDKIQYGEWSNMLYYWSIVEKRYEHLTIL